MEAGFCIEGAEFRGEGNSGLVCALKDGASVLKLKKTSVVFNEVSKDNVPIIDEDWLGLHKYQVSFIRNVAVPLLGASLVDVPTIVQLRGEDIAFLNHLVRKDRAIHRLKKTLSPLLNCGLVFPDNCLFRFSAQNNIPLEGPLICVELKTKMGFLPIGIPPDLHLKSRICRFHLVQNRKFRQGRIQQISNYCPLDLFSGCHERMECAILELLHNPQNNLRVFCDRRQIFGGERNRSQLDLGEFFKLSRDRGARDLCNLIRMALCLPLKEDRCKEATLGAARVESRDCIFSTKCCCDTESSEPRHHIPERSVLWRILQCQQLSLEDVSKIYHSFYTHHQPDRFFRKMFPEAVIPKNLMNETKIQNESKEDFEHRMLWKFLVALTCRDSSVMLTMQRIAKSWNGKLSDPKLNVLEYGGQRYLLSVGVVDLEPKKLDRVAKQFQDDLNMIRNFSMDF